MNLESEASIDRIVRMEAAARVVQQAGETLAEAQTGYNVALQGLHDAYRELKPDERSSLGQLPTVDQVMADNNNGYRPSRT